MLKSSVKNQNKTPKQGRFEGKQQILKSKINEGVFVYKENELKHRNLTMEFVRNPKKNIQIHMKRWTLIITTVLAVTVILGGCNDKEAIVDTQTNSLVDITSQQQFDDEVETGVAMIFFHASWCTKCAAQRPAVETVSEETAFVDVFFGEVEFEDFPDLVKDRGVQGFPTIIIFKDNKEQKRFTGQGHSEEEIRTALNSLQ